MGADTRSTTMGLHASPSLDASVDASPEPDSGEPLLVPGRTCWRIERAAQVAFLVDGEEYFGAIRSALAKARHSILILGWDIDSRMRLVPDGARDGLPEPLGEFLNEVVRRRRGLRGYVLSWDFAMLYAMEREWLPIYKLDWRTHRRLSFRLDNTHPVGASHHQKVVVVDDAVAFVGGYDLTRCRFDTSAHARNDPRRVDHRGVPYPPFHDVGMVVSGDCARALGDLARERWFRATGRRPRVRPTILPVEAWPDGIAPVASDVEVAISRTEPPQDGRPGVSEIKALHLDAIASARRCIFAENQYFTSRTITEAFARRLAADEGPEIAVLSPYTQSGWLEISTMGVLRARIHRILRAADHQARYRLYYPRLDALDSRHGCLNVHSKVLIIDDTLLTVGSSNLSDRSLGIDTECNLSLEARGDSRLRDVIGGLRSRLLAEHLGCTPREVSDVLAHEGSLHRAIEVLSRDDTRSLVPVEPTADPALDALAPDRHVFDPEQPLDPDAIVEDLVPHEQVRNGARTRLVVTLAGVFALAGMALAWRFTPLGEWLAFDRLLALGTAWRDEAWAPLVVMLAFIVAGLLVFPLTVLVVATAMVFGPWLGPVYTLAGATLSAAATFAIGRRLGRETVRRLAGARVNDLSRRLAKRGLLAVAFMRMLPIAPYSIVNVVAGASHIRWADFLLGTVIGLLPGVTALSFFVDRALAAIREPGVATFVLLVAAALVLVALAWALRRRLRGRDARIGVRAPVAHGS
jgi:phospholipase D1/2